jgi:L,D-transpeptidase catalytic domain
MCKRLPSALHFCGVVIVPALALMFAAPASAQVGSTGSGSSVSASSESQGSSGNILVTIDKSRQKMTVVLDGVTKYEWPVSTGKAGYSTPSGSYTATSMNEIWYSKEWDNAPMPHSVFFRKDGYAIHGSLEVRNLGRPASHGCVRISPENAATFFALVKKVGLKNTEVVLAGVTPGGEYKVARDSEARYGGEDSNSYYGGQTQWGGGYYAQPQPQWGGGGYYQRNPYYTDSQGYRRPPRGF